MKKPIFLLTILALCGVISFGQTTTAIDDFYLVDNRPQFIGTTINDINPGSQTEVTDIDLHANCTLVYVSPNVHVNPVGNFTGLNRCAYRYTLTNRPAHHPPTPQWCICS